MRILLICLSLTLLFAACGKSDADRLRFMMWGDSEERAAVDQYLAKFAEKNPKIGMPVVIHMDSFSYWDKFQVMIAAGEMPDVFYMGVEELDAYLKQDVLMDLNKLIERDKLDVGDFYEKLMKGYQRGGKQYVIPKDYSPLVLYYNKDMFKTAGIGLPDEDWTWTDLRNAALKLTKREATGAVSCYGFVVEDWASWMPSWIWSNGGEYMKDGKWVFGLEPYLTKNAQVFDFLSGMMLRDKVSPDVGTRKSIGGAGAFASQKLAMGVYGRWTVLNYKKIKDFRWGVAPFPKSPWGGERRTILFSAGYAIAKTCTRTDEAWELLKYLVSPECQRYVALSGQAVPARRSVAESKDFLESEEVNGLQTKLGNTLDNSVFVKSMEYGSLAPSHANWLKMRESLSQWFQSVWVGTANAREKLLETQPRFEQQMNAK